MEYFAQKESVRSMHKFLKTHPFRQVLRRFQAFVTALALALCPAAPPSLDAAPAVGSAAPHAASLAQDLNGLKLPSEIGKIEEYYSGSADQTLVLIQDAHSVPDAQKSIHRLIDFFQKKYGVDIVGLEGVSGSYDAALFRSFPDPEMLRSGFKTFLKSGELTGAAAAAVFNESDAVYQGIEDWKLYEQGTRQFLEALKRQPENLKQLQMLTERLDSEKTAVYSPELLEADRILRDFYLNQADFKSVLMRLADFLAPSQGSELALLVQEARKDESPVALTEEIKLLAGRIDRALMQLPSDDMLRNDQMQFNQRSQEYLTGRIDADAYGHFLKELVQKYGMRVQVSSHLRKRVERQQRMRDIQGSALFLAFEDYTESVMRSLFKNPEQESLNRQSRLLDLFARLVRLELSQEDWRKIQLLDQELRYWNIARDGLIAQSDVEGLLQNLQPNLDFYRTADRRDFEFYQRTQQLMRRQNRRHAMIVAGGFHTHGVTSILKSKGISYVLVVPHIDSLPEENHYQEHMTGRVSWRSYFRIENGSVNLHEAFVRAARDRLIDLAGSEGGKILKLWRDQIIRELAAEKRTGDAGRYTRFIDEAAKERLDQKYSGLESAWLENIDAFTKGVQRLQQSGSLTESALLQLIRSLVSQPMAPANGLAPGALAAADLLELVSSVVPDFEAAAESAAAPLTADSGDGTRSEQRNIVISQSLSDELRRVDEENFSVEPVMEPRLRLFLEQLPGYQPAAYLGGTGISGNLFLLRSPQGQYEVLKIAGGLRGYDVPGIRTAGEDVAAEFSNLQLWHQRWLDRFGERTDAVLLPRALQLIRFDSEFEGDAVQLTGFLKEEFDGLSLAEALVTDTGHPHHIRVEDAVRQFAEFDAFLRESGFSYIDRDLGNFRVSQGRLIPLDLGLLVKTGTANIPVTEELAAGLEARLQKLTGETRQELRSSEGGGYQRAYSSYSTSFVGKHYDQIEEYRKKVLPFLIERKISDGSRTLEIAVYNPLSGEVMAEILAVTVREFQKRGPQSAWGNIADWDIRVTGLEPSAAQLALARRTLFEQTRPVQEPHPEMYNAEFARKKSRNRAQQVNSTLNRNPVTGQRGDSSWAKSRFELIDGSIANQVQIFETLGRSDVVFLNEESENIMDFVPIVSFLENSSPDQLADAFIIGNADVIRTAFEEEHSMIFRLEDYAVARPLWDTRKDWDSVYFNEETLASYDRVIVIANGDRLSHPLLRSWMLFPGRIRSLFPNPETKIQVQSSLLQLVEPQGRFEFVDQISLPGEDEKVLIIQLGAAPDTIRYGKTPVLKVVANGVRLAVQDEALYSRSWPDEGFYKGVARGLQDLGIPAGLIPEEPDVLTPSDLSTGVQKERIRLLDKARSQNPAFNAGSKLLVVNPLYGSGHWRNGGRDFFLSVLRKTLEENPDVYIAVNEGPPAWRTEKNNETGKTPYQEIEFLYQELEGFQDRILKLGTSEPDQNDLLRVAGLMTLSENTVFLLENSGLAHLADWMRIPMFVRVHTAFQKYFIDREDVFDVNKLPDAAAEIGAQFKRSEMRQARGETLKALLNGTDVISSRTLGEGDKAVSVSVVSFDDFKRLNDDQKQLLAGVSVELSRDFRSKGTVPEGYLDTDNWLDVFYAPEEGEDDGYKQRVLYLTAQSPAAEDPSISGFASFWILPGGGAELSLIGTNLERGTGGGMFLFDTLAEYLRTTEGRTFLKWQATQDARGFTERILAARGIDGAAAEPDEQGYYFLNFGSAEERSEQRAAMESFLQSANPAGVFVIDGGFDAEGKVAPGLFAALKSALEARKSFMIDVESLVQRTPAALQPAPAPGIYNDDRMEEVEARLRSIAGAVATIVNGFDGAYNEEGLGRRSSGFVLTELLKNAVFHGNRLDLSLPVAFQLDFTGGQLLGIDVFDFGRSEPVNRFPFSTLALSGEGVFQATLEVETDYRPVHLDAAGRIQPVPAGSLDETLFSRVSVRRGIKAAEPAGANRLPLNQHLFDLHQSLAAREDFTETSRRYQKIIGEIALDDFIRNQMRLSSVRAALVPIGSPLKGYAVSDSELRPGETASDLEYVVLVLEGEAGEVRQFLDQRQDVVNFVSGRITAQGIEAEFRQALQRFFDLSWVARGETAGRDLKRESVNLTYLFLPAQAGDQAALENARRAAVNFYRQDSAYTALWEGIMKEHFQNVHLVVPSSLEKPHILRWVREHFLNDSYPDEKFLIAEGEDLQGQERSAVRGDRLARFNALRLFGYTLPSLDELAAVSAGRSEQRTADAMTYEQWLEVGQAWEDAAAAAKIISRLEVPSRRIRRVLIAEDRTYIRELYQRIFAYKPFKGTFFVEYAENGDDALAIFNAAQHSAAPFDLLLTDRNMPSPGIPEGVKAGDYLVEKIRSRGILLPILMVTDDPGGTQAVFEQPNTALIEKSAGTDPLSGKIPHLVLLTDVMIQLLQKTGQLDSRSEMRRVQVAAAGREDASVAAVTLALIPPQFQTAGQASALEDGELTVLIGMLNRAGIATTAARMRRTAEDEISRRLADEAPAPAVNRAELEAVSANYQALRSGLRSVVTARIEEGTVDGDPLPFILDIPAEGDVRELGPVITGSLQDKTWLSKAPYLNVSESSVLSAQLYSQLKSRGYSPRNDRNFRTSQLEIREDLPQIGALTLSQGTLSAEPPSGIFAVTHDGRQIRYEDLTHEEKLALMEIKLFEIWAKHLKTTAEALLLQYDPGLLRFFQIQSRTASGIVFNLDRFQTEMRTLRAVETSA